MSEQLYIEHPLKETALFAHQEIVTVLPQRVVRLDENFPSIEINPGERPASVGIQVVDHPPEPANNDQPSTPNKIIAEATKFLGRGVFRSLNKPITTKDGKRSFTFIKTKVTGAPQIVRNSWDDYKNKPPIFYHEPTSPHGDKRTDLIRKAAWVGLGSHLRERQVADAKNSLLLHNRGVKARLPLTGKFIDAFYMYDESSGETKLRGINGFKNQGLKEEELYQSDWLVSCPLTMEDVNDILVNILDENGEDKIRKLTQFVTALLELARLDISKEYQDLVEKWREIQVEATEDNLQKIYNLLVDFGVALSKTMGRNFDRMYNSNQNPIKHRALHDQNITFFGEIADNFSVKKGILEIGLAPENSADLDGFRLAIRKYAFLVAEIVKDGDKNQLLQTFFAAVRESWNSYNHYCETMQIQEAKDHILYNQEKLKMELLLSGIEEDDLDFFKEQLLELAKSKVGKIKPFG